LERAGFGAEETMGREEHPVITSEEYEKSRHRGDEVEEKQEM
jgi:hypothetical protein